MDLAGAAEVEQVLDLVGELLHRLHAERAGVALDRVERPEDVVQQLLVAGIRLELQDRRLDRAEVVERLGDEHPGEFGVGAQDLQVLVSGTVVERDATAAEPRGKAGPTGSLDPPTAAASAASAASVVTFHSAPGRLDLGEALGHRGRVRRLCDAAAVSNAMTRSRPGNGDATSFPASAMISAPIRFSPPWRRLEHDRARQPAELLVDFLDDGELRATHDRLSGGVAPERTARAHTTRTCVHEIVNAATAA